MQSRRRGSLADLIDDQRPVVTASANIANPLGERYNADAKIVAVSKVHPNPNQPRRHFNQEALEELSVSIRQSGVMQPLMVRPRGDGYEIVMGERRYRAVLLAGVEEIPVIVRAMDDEEAFVSALAENLQRQDLEPADEAEAYQGLIRRGYSENRISELIGIAQSRVNRVVRIHTDPVLSEAVSDRLITKSDAQELLALPEESRPRLVQFVAYRRKENQPLTREELRSRVKDLNPRASEPVINGGYAQRIIGHKADGLSGQMAEPDKDSSTDPQLEEARKHSAALRMLVDSRPLLAWDEQVAADRKVIEEIAHRVSGRPADEG